MFPRAIRTSTTELSLEASLFQEKNKRHVIPGFTSGLEPIAQYSVAGEKSKHGTFRYLEFSAKSIQLECLEAASTITIMTASHFSWSHNRSESNRHYSIVSLKEPQVCKLRLGNIGLE